MKKVLVLDANQRSALAVTRSLGRHDIDLFTADETKTALAGCSRYSRAYYRYPSPKTEPEAFSRAIMELCRVHRIDLLLPMTELTSTLLLQVRDALPAALPFADKASVDRLVDKCALFRLAEDLRVPVPETRYFDNAEALLPCLPGMNYPMVLKPARSWLVCNGSWMRSTVRIVHNEHQAKQILQQDPVFARSPFMVQEFIKGFGQGVFALYDNGQPVAFFSHRRLREKPPGGGVSVLAESVAVDERQLEYARALLDAADWHGIAMVEYRVGNDGTPYLMEINTRFWGSLQLSVDAGVDFPYLLYQVCQGKRPQAVEAYREGRRLRWLLGDLDSLYLTLRDPGVPARQKLTAILSFVRPSPFTTRHEVDRFSDLGPFWHEVKQYLADLG